MCGTGKVVDWRVVAPSEEWVSPHFVQMENSLINRRRELV